MQASVRAAALRFSREFNSEISRAIFAGQPGFRPMRPGREPEESADRLRRTTQPQLVRNFYQVQNSEDGSLKLLVFNQASGEFESNQWPALFSKLRERMQSPGQGGFGPGRPGFSGVVDEEIPAIAVRRGRPPMERPGGERGPNRERGPGAPPPPGVWSIVEFNRQYLESEFLPELVHKHFAGKEGLEYQVRVVPASGSEKAIYQSDPSLAASFFDKSDEVAFLFSLRPEPMGRGPGFGGRMRGPGSPPEPSGPPGGPEVDQPGWRALIKHHSGSLGAVVESARRRNLAVSFAVLLLMGASMVMLVITTRRAERLARLQMEFVAGVSHELRTPLSVICSAGDNLADGLVGSEQQVKRYGSVIRNEGRRLAEMVEQILGFAGIGRAKYSLQPVAVSSVIDRALAASDLDIRQSGFTVEKTLPDGLPLIQADSTALAHCVRNLISNALKYGGDNRRIGVRAAAAGAMVEISVQDYGPGIDPTDLPHIFEPFYRGRRAVDDQIHGAGLGLSLVKRIMEAHGGSAAVESKPGPGSKFVLRIPASAAPAEAFELKEHGTENPAG
jgi:signal transduction histidine kinase